MKEEILARRYARALFALGEEQSSLERLQEELIRFKEVLVIDPLLPKYLGFKEVEMKKKRSIVETICTRAAISPLVRNFLQLLLQKGRMPIFLAVVDEFCELLRRAQNTVLARVEAVNERGFQSFRDSLKIALEKKLGKKVELQICERPALVGGFTVRVGDTIYDASVLGSLERFQQSF